MSYRDHIVSVPLDHGRPDGEQISVFAREMVQPGKEDADLPWLLFLQGGPGFASPRPNAGAPWFEPALREFRVLLLDQRGTGNSSPLNRQTLAGMTPQEQSERMACFRADSIVGDCEVLRREIAGGRPWTILGQSFGGFCAVTYLSFVPEGVERVLITGGLPSLSADAEAVYRAAYPRMLRRNAGYFAAYPADRQVVSDICRELRANDVRLPSGERLTARRFLTLGITFGMDPSYEPVHFALEGAFVETVDGAVLSDRFLQQMQALLTFASFPLHSALHEAIYCQGAASNWAADRVRAEFPEFDPDASEPLFTGEMMYPWQFDEDPALVPLKEAADLLARREDWGTLYDVERLRHNTVPVAAIVYYDDMYVDREGSLATAAEISGLRLWVTNEYEHNGVRKDPRVFERLLALSRGE